MNVVVFGAGAVGGVFAARIAAAGNRVTIVGRPEIVDAVRRSGLRVEGTDPTTVAVDAIPRLPSARSTDAVLVTVKTFDLGAAAESIGRHLPPTPTLLLENGLGIEPPFVDGLRQSGWPRPEDWVVRAVHSVPSTLVGPGVVRAAGTGEVVLPSPAGRGTLAGPIERLYDLLHRAGFAVRLDDDFERQIWRKALVNAAINPVTAIHAVPNGRLADGALRDEARGLLVEALAVARAEGYAGAETEATEELDRVVRATAANRSSMLQDVERGRPTEVDAISGELIRRGEKLGLELPRTREAVRAVRRRARGAGAPQA